MARTNQKASAPDVRTHGGARAALHMTNEQALRRSVMSCMLWENTFYEDGESIAERIKALAAAVPAETLASIAIEARTQHNLRHVPLLLCVELARRGGSIVGDTIARVVQRADEVPELVSLYWSQNPSKGKDAAGRTVNAPLSSQMKRGLALALTRFDAYQLAKYNRDSAVKLRDVMFLVHAKPKDEAQAATWKQLVDGTLAAPDTWEVGLSSGADKRETFTRLLREKKLGYMALLRNLRNMVDANVDQDLIVDAIRARKGAERVLPFRYVSAARACPRLEPVLDEALRASIAEMPALPGKTVVLVDVSGSMGWALSDRSDINRMDAAATLASMINGDLRVFTFSERLVEVAPRRGMAGVDAIKASQPHSGTQLFSAVETVTRTCPYDRIIVITDEQATDHRGSGMPSPHAGAKAYVINVATYQNGVGYGRWTTVNGFSESVLRWIVAHEQMEQVSSDASAAA